MPDDYPAAVLKTGRDAPRDPAEIARVYATYEQTKRDRGVIDFEDVLLLTAAILEDRPEIGAQVRAQYRHFTVDEYQDVSPLQQRLLDQWTGGGASLCVVGDASQTIYSFTGATPDFLLNFRHRHPEATVVKLVRDYRSTPQVVHLANGLLSQARGQAAQHRLELVSQREAGPEPVYVEYADEPTEAETTAQRIKELMAQGVRASEIAVLFRTNGQSEVYEQALADLGISYQLKGAERFFERPEVREAGVLLKGAARAGEDPLTADAPDLAAQVRAVLATRASAPTRRPAPAPCVSAGSRWPRWSGSPRSSRRAAGRPANAPTWRRTSPSWTPGPPPSTPPPSRASPWPRCTPPRAWSGTPSSWWDSPRAPCRSSTPRRTSRSRRSAGCCTSASPARGPTSRSPGRCRAPRGRASRKPTRFLDGLRPGSGAAGPRSRGGRGGVEAGADRSAARRARGPVKCRVCDRTLTEAVERKLRRCETCPSSMDEALFERLREWRARQAKQQGVPAYVVFTDATLMAIAEDVPAGERELAVISGVGAMKLDKYGAAVLSLCAGEDPWEDSAEEPAGEPVEESAAEPAEESDEPA